MVTGFEEFQGTEAFGVSGFRALAFWFEEGQVLRTLIVAYSTFKISFQLAVSRV